MATKLKSLRFLLAFAAFTHAGSASIVLTIVTDPTVTSSFTPASSDMYDSSPAQITYTVAYDIIPEVDFSGLNSGDTITLDVIAPVGFRFEVKPEDSFQFSTYNRWFESGKNVGSGGLSSLTFELLDLVGNAPSANLNSNLLYQGNDASNFLYSSFF